MLPKFTACQQRKDPSAAGRQQEQGKQQKKCQLVKNESIPSTSIDLAITLGASTQKESLASLHHAVKKKKPLVVKVKNDEQRIKDDAIVP
jgi:hypothetical protein